MVEDQRRHYRVQPDPALGLVVTLIAPGTTGRAGQLLDVSVAGACVIFPRGEGPRIGLNADVTLVFSSPQLAEPIAIEAVSAWQVEQVEGVRFGFKFSIKRTLAGQLYGLFNRRRFYGVKPDPSEPIEILCSPLGDEPAEPPALGSGDVVAVVEYISAGGVSIDVAPSVAGVLQGNLYVSLSFDVRGASDRRVVVGRTCNTRNPGKVLRCGLEFDRNHSPGFPETEMRLNRYVMERQRLLLLQSSHTE